MTDETPTLRLGPSGIEDDDEKWGHWAHLLLGATFAGYVVGASPECITALAAALDPRTTEVLFEQRDAAIERAKAAEDERDELLEAYTSRRPASEAALLQRLRAERDTAIEERDRLRQTLAEVDAERVRLAIQVRRLEALRCNTCGHVKAEPREGDRA